jgi:hypothetical protein
MQDTPWAGLTFTPPTPLDIAAIETAIVNQLSNQINTIEVTHYPDRPESYRLTHRVGAALVRFESGLRMANSSTRRRWCKSGRSVSRSG